MAVLLLLGMLLQLLGLLGLQSPLIKQHLSVARAAAVANPGRRWSWSLPPWSCCRHFCRRLQLEATYLQVQGVIHGNTAGEPAAASRAWDTTR